MNRRDFLAIGMGVAMTGCVGRTVRAMTPALPAISTDEQRATIAALRPPKRSRPVVAIIGSAHGAETCDVILPWAILRQSGLADVALVAESLAPVPLMPALTIQPTMTLTDFDRSWPDGVDYVIVPALHESDDRVVTSWLVRQSRSGALIAAICAGALVLSEAGLIGDRRATTHWYQIGTLRKRNPKMSWTPDRRYVVDRGIATTTGVSAALPFSIALVEAIGGPDKAAQLAEDVGIQRWDAAHDSARFRLGAGAVATVVGNTLARLWTRRMGIAVDETVDEIALALTVDAWSHTHRSRVFAVSPRGGWVTGRRGLSIQTVPRAQVDETLPPPRRDRPAAALDTALDDITKRFGSRTAALVALYVEYDRTRR